MAETTPKLVSKLGHSSCIVMQSIWFTSSPWEVHELPLRWCRLVVIGRSPLSIVNRRKFMLCAYRNVFMSPTTLTNSLFLRAINVKSLCELQMRFSDRWNRVDNVLVTFDAVPEHTIQSQKKSEQQSCVCEQNAENESLGCEISQRWPGIGWWILSSSSATSPAAKSIKRVFPFFPMGKVWQHIEIEIGNSLELSRCCVSTLASAHVFFGKPRNNKNFKDSKDCLRNDFFMNLFLQLLGAISNNKPTPSTKESAQRNDRNKSSKNKET